MYIGLRFIPLRTPGGETASHIGIFVNIMIDELSQKQASSSGMCSLESPNKGLPTQRQLFNTRKLSIEEIIEDTDSAEGDEDSKEKRSTLLDNSAMAVDVVSEDVVQNPPKMINQEGIIEFTVKLNATPNNTMHITNV